VDPSKEFADLHYCRHSTVRDVGQKYDGLNMSLLARPVVFGEFEDDGPRLKASTRTTSMNNGTSDEGKPCPWRNPGKGGKDSEKAEVRL
jgi:hypothetical protein